MRVSTPTSWRLLIALWLLLGSGSHPGVLGEAPRPPPAQQSSRAASPGAPPRTTAANRFFGRNPKRPNSLNQNAQQGGIPRAARRSASSDLNSNAAVAKLFDEELEMSSSRIAGRGDDEDDDYRGRGHEGSTASGDAEDFDFEGLNFMGGFLNDDLDDDSKDDASDYNLKDRRLDGDSREYEELETTRRRPGWAASSIAKTAGSDSPSYRDGNPRNQQQQQGKEQPDWTDSDSGGLYGSHISTNNKEAMYEAYNQLHVLAQEYNKPFDAPAVVVVGHQSSGKSALIEALMGFQFNQVGGGTKTRRPVALRMQYNPNCRQPRWYLLGDDGVERPMMLSEIQDYIEKENRRLERDPMRSFDSREINLRMEYRHCPNMILIDTPGLIAAPRIPKVRSGGTSAALAQQRALAAAAKEAERLVVDKMRCEDYIILCVEDTSDWKHGATREIVQKADPDLSRTVIVNTKLDTKIPQFSSPSDVEDFLRATVLDRISPHRLGGPYYTSVPSGRVGRSSDFGAPVDSGSYLFNTDEDFVHACADAESSDSAIVMQRLKRVGGTGKGVNKDAASASPIHALTSRIGLNNLRSFLEQRVDECYRRNVRKIIPMLQAEYETAERRLQTCEKELEALSVDRLKAGAEAFCDEFCVCLRKAMQGSIMAPVSLFGETLKQETSAAGSFHDVQGCPMAVSDRTWDRLVDRELANHNHRLYGGSQYHRTLREFQLACRCLRLPSISDDEIANAAGLGDTHDGVNFLHSACTIALEKARVSFDPMLRALQSRMKHVMDRLCPVTEYMLRETRDRSKLPSVAVSTFESGGVSSAIGSLDPAMDISQNPQFRQLVRSIFEKFVQQCSESAMSKSQDDLVAITRYVTWSLNERGSGALKRSLPDQTDMIAVYQVALRSKKRGGDGESTASDPDGGVVATLDQRDDSSSKALTPMSDDRRSVVERDYQNLLQLVEETIVSRDTNRTNVVVTSLVQHIVSNWREQFCKAVTTKYNCYYMLPFVDQFHRFIRTELQKVYAGDGNDLTDVFDLAAVRRNLQKHREDLLNECMANKRIQEKFRMCSQQIRPQEGNPTSAPSAFEPPSSLRSRLLQGSDEL